uniref:Mitochondrial potassium channel ATP-binding subunit n=1 Tax=Acrobeloides nanus TaxID=290746 RepID=A0A914DKB6_9BILA
MSLVNYLLRAQNSYGIRFQSTIKLLHNRHNNLFRECIKQIWKLPTSKTKIFNGIKLCGIGFCCKQLFFTRIAHCATTTKSSRLTSNREVVVSKLTWREFWKIIKPYLHWLIIAAITAIIVAVMNIKIPILLGDLINVIAGFIKSKSTIEFSKLNPIATRLMVLYFAQAIFTFFYITCLSIMGEKIATDLRVQLFTQLLHQDMSFYDSQKTGELCDRLSYDVQEFKSSFKSCIAQGLRTFAQTGGCIVSLYMISPKMTLLTVIVVPVVILFGSLCGVVLRRLSIAAHSQNAYAAGVAEEAFQNIRTVKSFAMEDGERSLYAGEIEKARVLNEQLGVGIGAFQAATNVFLNGIILGILYGGAHLMASSQLSPGDLMSFLVSAQTIQRSLSQFSLVFGNAVKGWTACARIPHHSFTGELEFHDVSFIYPTRPSHHVIEHLNLTIEPGKTTALCGPSGAGKSTVAALVERLYEPQKGKITLDGKDLSDLDPYWLRRNAIGVISQEPVLFATTIEENIRYGKPEATDEEVREAARLANAADFIETFPHGYKTLVGERGVTLSGGQKQRIAIARALLKDPPILILDEATSALDAQTLDVVMRNRTVIIIAHRLSTIRNADTICVLRHGKVVEKGSHQVLMKKKGVYYSLVEMQQEED